MARIIGHPAKKIVRSQKNLDAVVRAQSLLAEGKTHRSTRRESAWRRSEKMWEGKQWNDSEAEGDLVTVNMSFSTVNTIVPYITGSDPTFLVEPYSGEATVQRARGQQAILNRTWRSGRMAGNSHLKRMGFDALIYGDGFGKASYSIDEVLQGGKARAIEVANLWVDRISPWDVWLDPSAAGLHDARWAIIRVMRSVAELKAEKKFSHTKLLGSSSEADDNSGREPARDVTGDERDMMVAVYEFYDIASRELIVFTDQVDLPLQFVEEITCPLAAMANHPLSKSPFSMGELEQLRWLQDELNKTRTQQIEHRRRNAAKYVVRPASLGSGAKDALESEEVNAVVEITDTTRTLEDIVMPLKMATISGDSYNVDATIKQDIYEISGVNEYLRGATPEIRRTATEATIIEGASNIKTAHKLRMVEAAARRLGQLLLGMMADVFPLTEEDEVALILTGKEAQALALADPEVESPAGVTEARLVPDADLFKGVYEVFVEQGSTELRNPLMREQKYREMAMALVEAAPILKELGVPINYRKSFEMWFEAAGIDDLAGMFDESSLPPQPSQGLPLGPAAADGTSPDGPQEIPPELLAALSGGGGGQMGAPAAPTDVLNAENTGMLPPSV